MRELSDEPHEVSSLFKDVGANGRIDGDENKVFKAVLEKLYGLTGRILGINGADSTAAPA